MFLLLTIFALSRNLGKKRFLESEDEDEEGDFIFDLISNVDEILNSGIASELFNKTVTALLGEGLIDRYEEITSNLANKSYQLYDLIHQPDDKPDHPDYDYPDYPDYDKHEYEKGFLSSYISTEKKLCEIIDCESYFEQEESKEMFRSISKIVSELGPHLAKAANIDFGPINNVFNYVVFNKDNGNDKVKFGEILKKLGLPTDWVPQLQKVVANFDDSVSISSLFEGLNSQTEYNTFVSNVEKLLIPKDKNEKFFSVNRVIEVLSSAIDLLRAINNNFVQRYLNSLVKPIITKYGLKPINIFEVSLKERASSLLNIINSIKGYENSCEKENSDDFIKCTVYETVLETAKDMFCYVDYDHETYEPIYDKDCVKDVFGKITRLIQPFTQDEVNIQDVLVKEYKIDKNTVLFVTGLIANLTDKEKTYLDIIEGMPLLYKDGSNISFLTYEDVPVDIFYKNISKLVKFLNTVDDSSNFKDIFDYLNADYIWSTLTEYIKQIDKNTKVCDLLEYEGDDCKSLEEMIKNIATNFISEDSFYTTINSALGGITDYLVQFGIPALKNINNNFAQFLSKSAKDILDEMNKDSDIKINSNINFENVIKNSGNTVDKILSLINELIPSVIEKLPFIGDLYPQFFSKAHGLVSVFKDNKNVGSLLDSLYDGTGILIQMISNAAKAYVDDKTTVLSIVKALTPTTFLDVHSTATAITKLTSYGIKDLINSIKYDGSNAKLLADSLNFNDVIPVKTVAANSEKLASSMEKNDLKVNVVADSLGVETKQITDSLKSTVNKVVSSPSEVVKDVAVSVGADKDKIDSVIDNFAGLATEINEGKNSKPDKTVDPDKKKGLPIGAIIGIVVGCVVVVGVAIFLGVYFGVVKKRNKDNSEQQNDSDGGKKNDDDL